MGGVGTAPGGVQTVPDGSGRLLVGPLVANSLTCLSIRRDIQSANMMLVKSFP